MTENSALCIYSEGVCGVEAAHENFRNMGNAAWKLLICCPTFPPAWMISPDPLMHTGFNHHPGQYDDEYRRAHFRASQYEVWINYGLGSESDNLPGYVVLTAGRGTSGGHQLVERLSSLHLSGHSVPASWGSDIKQAILMGFHQSCRRKP